MELNVSVLIAQWFNFLIILFLFKYFVGDEITKAIIARRRELSKAEDATRIYEETLAKAEEEKKQIIAEALDHKNNVVQEASLVAEQKAHWIISAAEKTAAELNRRAEEETAKIKSDLEKNFIKGVKQTTRQVVTKLVWWNPQLQEDYIESLAKEFNS